MTKTYHVTTTAGGTTTPEGSKTPKRSDRKREQTERAGRAPPNYIYSPTYRRTTRTRGNNRNPRKNNPNPGDSNPSTDESWIPPTDRQVFSSNRTP